jgi:lipoyl(octanoyl) transferase
MDLSPFSMIDPCGYSGLEVTQLKDLGINDSMETISTQFQTHFERLLDKPAP